MPVSTLKEQCAISRDNVDTFHRLQTLPPSQARAWKRVPVQTPSALFPKCSSQTGQKGPGFPGGDSTEETMDVSGPAQEQEPSSSSGTRASEELVWQTSKGEGEEVGSKDQGPKV